MAVQDAELVRGAVAGSPTAFRDLVLRYQRPVYSLVLRMVREPALAEDLAQEVFVKAHRALASFDPQRKFSSWLFKIAHNATIDHLRRREVTTVPLETPGKEGVDLLARLPAVGAETPAAAVERRDLGRAIQRAVADLRPEYREVFLLRFQEGLAYDEIAEVMGLPLGTVKTHLHRARKALAGWLEAAGWGP